MCKWACNFGLGSYKSVHEHMIFESYKYERGLWGIWGKREVRWAPFSGDGLVGWVGQEGRKMREGGSVRAAQQVRTSASIMSEMRSQVLSGQDLYGCSFEKQMWGFQESFLDACVSELGDSRKSGKKQVYPWSTSRGQAKGFSKDWVPGTASWL